MWKGKVDEQTIEMFLDKIFELHGCSVFDFERYMMDVACGSADIPKFGDVCESCREECHEDCEWCDELEERIDETQSLIRDLKDQRDEEKKEKETAIQQRNEAVTKYHALKNNAVLFSPDDLKDIVPEYEQKLQGRYFDDDDIPF